MPFQYIWIFALANLLMTPSFSQAQETNYWVLQHGGRSNLLGGAVVAGVKDNSSLFYNPGDLIYTKGASFSAVGDLYFVDWYNIKNGAGQDIDLRKTSLDGFPQMVSGISKFKNNPKWTLSYSLFTKNSTNSRINTSVNKSLKLNDSLPGNELYRANFYYYNRQMDYWGGIAASYKLSENFGIGLTQFITLHSQDYIKSQDARALYIDPSNGQETNLGYYSLYESMDKSSVGLLWKLGLAWRLGKLDLGLTMTTPKVNMDFVSKANTRRSLTLDVPGQEFIQEDAINQKATAIYKSPWIVDLGLNYSFPKSELSARIGFFSAVAPYNMIIPLPKDSIEMILEPEDPELGIPKMAARPIVNVAIGYETLLKEGLTFMSGFRTDFNYYDNEALPREGNFIPSLTFWNIYHLNSGFTFFWKKLAVTAGAGYSIGYKQGNHQIANISDPGGENGLIGSLNGNGSTKAIHNRISLIFGFTYFVDGIKKLTN